MRNLIVQHPTSGWSGPPISIPPKDQECRRPLNRGVRCFPVMFPKSKIMLLQPIFQITITLVLSMAVLQGGTNTRTQNQVELHPGKVNGIVKDAHDAAVPNALISFESRLNRKKSKLTVKANGDGLFEIELPAGIYRVTVKVSGYRNFQRKELVIEAERTFSFDIVLKENPRKVTTITE